MIAKKNRGFEDKLQNFKREVESPSRKFLPKLDNIARGEAESWAASEPVQGYVHKWANMVGEVTTVFDEWEKDEKKSTIPMSTLVCKLTPLLKKFHKNNFFK
ncbi:MAG: hypothetical protein AAF702_25420 [Chloroflexota bacterium]